jgi:hypothetical protein
MHENIVIIAMIIVGLMAFRSATASFLIAIAPNKNPEKDRKVQLSTALPIGFHQAIWHLFPWT